MKLHFTYNTDKDIENFINGTRAVNSKKPTKFQIAFSEKYGDNFESEKVKEFITEQDTITGFDANKEIVAIEERWKIAEPIFIERAEKIFGISYPAPIITVYLTHNERCTYNIEQNYFFVRIGSEFSTNTIMHELLHFYTWHAFGKKLLDEGLSKLAYNDIKESLTELLNLEFSDLLNGKNESGYPQHQEMRAKIHEMWQAKKDIGAVINTLVSEQIKSGKPLSSHKDRKYEINSYDPNWSQQFAEHAKILKSIFADEAISIEHIGSTAVPGLAGKPTIDILILVDDVIVADRLEKQMEIAGYHALGEYVTKGARLFVKESNNTRYCNIHVFQKSHPHVKEMLQLRDYFRAHPEIVTEYSKLKTDLATKYPNDYGEYRKYKDEWMNKLKQKLFAKPKRIRAVAIIVNDGKVLLIHRISHGKEYHVFPGGGVENGETVEQAVLREVQEETSLEVKIEKLLYHHIYDDNTEQFFYLCQYVSGKPKLGDGNEARDMEKSNDNFYNPDWYEIKGLPQLLLYPLEIRDWFIEDIKTNFENVPKKANIKVSDLRQSL